nr:hypothetical protein [Tanacetum cinerariifolium]GFB32964.1 hypothetical protein [Tanacetum cinerariifolium]
SNPKSQIFVTEDCDDGSRHEENLVVACSNEEIIKYPTQSATNEISEISAEDGSNLKEFLDVLSVEESDTTGPIMAVEDEENNFDSVLKDVGGIVYHKGDDTRANVGMKHGLRRNSNISGLISIHIFQHVELLADRHEKIVVQRKV